jgi:hypothetical protein
MISQLPWRWVVMTLGDGGPGVRLEPRGGFVIDDVGSFERRQA